jgi:hypothetical protein
VRTLVFALVLLIPLSPRVLGGVGGGAPDFNDGEAGGRSPEASQGAQRPAAGRGEGGGSPTGSDPPPHGTATARVEKPEVRLGEPFRYELEIRHPASETWALPEKVALEPFRATEPVCRREEQGGEAITTCALRLALYALGPHDVPAVALTVRTGEGDATVAVAGPRVTGVGIIDPKVPSRELALRDPSGPVPLLVRSWRVLWWTLGALALAALAAAAVVAWRRRARAAVETPPPIPPHVRFVRRLEALEAERLAARGLGREHVARVSELVREYLAALTGEPALDLTTGELVARLAPQGDPRLDLAALRAFLEDADLVKFAKADAGECECAAATAFARDLHARTSPPIVIPAPERP